MFFQRRSPATGKPFFCKGKCAMVCVRYPEIHGDDAQCARERMSPQSRTMLNNETTRHRSVLMIQWAREMASYPDVKDCFRCVKQASLYDHRNSITRCWPGFYPHCWLMAIRQEQGLSQLHHQCQSQAIQELNLVPTVPILQEAENQKQDRCSRVAPLDWRNWEEWNDRAPWHIFSRSPGRRRRGLVSVASLYVFISHFGTCFHLCWTVTTCLRCQYIWTGLLLKQMTRTLTWLLLSGVAGGACPIRQGQGRGNRQQCNREWRSQMSKAGQKSADASIQDTDSNWRNYLESIKIVSFRRFTHHK